MVSTVQFPPVFFDEKFIGMSRNFESKTIDENKQPSYELIIDQSIRFVTI